jgi:hypothetical protein
VPVEFRGSMALFLIVLALAKARLPLRLLVEGFLAIRCLWHTYWDLFLFFAGLLLAELYFILDASTSDVERIESSL